MASRRPSVTGAEVIGQGSEDYALNVGFDDDTTAWFGRALVEFLDVSAGIAIGIGGRRYVRAANGDWIESSDSKQTKATNRRSTFPGQ
jgi:hypothetical protein